MTICERLKIAESDLKDAEYLVKILRAKLTQAESNLIGCKKEVEVLREEYRVELSHRVSDIATSREVEILTKRGYHICAGDCISPELRKVLFEIGCEKGGEPCETSSGEK